MASEWADHPAAAITVHVRGGPSIALGRDTDGTWREMKMPMGSEPSHWQGPERLTSDELIEALRGPIRGDG